MKRRAFLARLGFGTVAAAAAATGVLDLERLLWVPGEKTIFLPPPPTIAPVSAFLQRGDIFTIEGRYAINPTTYRPTERLQQFVVISDVKAGEALDTLQIRPLIITDGPYMNVTGPKQGPQIDGRTITTFGWSA